MAEWHDFVSNRNGQSCLECDQPPDHEVHLRRLVEGAALEWAGDSPFFLVYEPPEGKNIGFDLDVPGWIAANQGLFREPGTWLLMTKEGMRPLFVVFIRRGDQFYYAKRHTGVLGGATAEVTAIGIGKKQADGRTVNLWIMPNGMVCGGDDVDFLSQRMMGLKP